MRREAFLKLLGMVAAAPVGIMAIPGGYTEIHTIPMSIPDITSLWPSSTPFMTLIANQPKLPISDPMFKYFWHRNDA